MSPTLPNGKICYFDSQLQRGELKEIFSALSSRRMGVYWTDFLISLAMGYLALALFPVTHLVSWRAGLSFVIATFSLYRAAIFTHEIAHMPRHRYKAFRFVWNLLCGVPLLIPSFMYEMHNDHHSQRKYGTREDGEYLSFAVGPRRRAIYYVLSSFLAVPLLAIRFLLLAPLRWLFPSLNQFVLTRASALSIDGEYVRPVETTGIPRMWFLQEASCCLWCASVFGLVFTGVLPITRLAQACAILTAVVLVNAFRVLAAHRYRSMGQPLSLAEQVRDSNDFPSLLDELWAPVGLRFHAVHHLLPQLPYHALPEARRRILLNCGQHHPLGDTSRDSLFGVLRELFQKGSKDARENEVLENEREQVCHHEDPDFQEDKSPPKERQFQQTSAGS